MLMLQIMQHEGTTSELAEILGVTRKTIALWSQQGIMEKLRHGRYDLKRSLENWAAYQKCVFEGHHDPLAIWQIRRDIAWSEAHPLRVDLEDLRDISELELVDIETLVVELPG
jgi:hypothetical protein